MFSIFWPFKLAAGIFKFFLNLLVCLSCVLTLMALMGDKGWIWSLTTHFRMQYLVVQLLALFVGGISLWKSSRSKNRPGAENWLSLAVVTFFAGINLLAIAPYYMPSANAAKSSEIVKGHLKLMHCNLFGIINRDTDSVVKAIQETQPDIIDLVEYTGPWQESLERSGVFKKYPYHFAGRGHIGVYSKVPLQNPRLVFTSATRKVTNHANIITTIRLGGEPVTLLVGHPASPIRPSHLQWLQQSFGVWEKERPKLGENLIIVGDLNTSPWSVEFHQLTRRTGLRDSQLGFGIQPSWPMLMPAIGLRSTPTLITDLLAIPIDHVLVSQRVAVLSRKTGPFVGSDHLPVVIELGMTPKSNGSI
jgi:endonuclease/exonuclease/phosphatase (EEP) superfamily protein YafD